MQKGKSIADFSTLPPLSISLSLTSAVSASVSVSVFVPVSPSLSVCLSLAWMSPSLSLRHFVCCLSVSLQFSLYSNNAAKPSSRRATTQVSTLPWVEDLIGNFKKGRGNIPVLSFEFKNLGLHIPEKVCKEPGGKTLLKNVTGQLRAGKVTAIMGPSGTLAGLPIKEGRGRGREEKDCADERLTLSND